MNYKKLILSLIITVASVASHAADRYWVSNVLGFSDWSNTANWSTTSGGAGGASVPGVNDMAIFDTNGSSACRVNINANIYGIHLRNGYNGNVDMQAGITMVIGAGNATFNDAAFNGADGDITVNGNFTILGSNFRSTTGILTITKDFTYLLGGFDERTGTVRFSGANQTFTGTLGFHNLELTGSGNKDVNPTSIWFVRNLFTFSSNSVININGGTINVEGDMLISNTHVSNNGTGLIRITGANNQTITSTSTAGRGELPNVEINKSAGIATFDGIVSAKGNWVYVSGNIDYTSNDATVALTGGDQTIAGGETFNNFHIHGSGTKNIAATITALGLFTFSSGNPININGSPINVEGDMLISNTHPSNNGTGLIRITGANNQTITSTSTVGRGELPNVEINKSGGTAIFDGIISTNKNWAYVGGNVDYTANDATVALTGGDQTIAGGETFNNFHIHGSGTKNIAATITALGLFTFSSGNPININGSPINVEGDMLISNTHPSNNGTGLIRITGANNQTITSTSSAGRGELPNVEINKSGGTAIFDGIISTNKNWAYVGGNVDYTANDATIALTGGDQTITGGETFNNLHIRGSGTKNIAATITALGLFTFSSNSPIHINGSSINVEGDMLISNTHPNNNGTGLIRITGASNQTITSTSTAGRGELPNIEIDKSGGVATLIGVLSSNGNWEFINGNFDAATNTATVSLYGSDKTINGGDAANHMSFYTLRLNGNNIVNTATGDIYVNNLLILNDADLLLNGHELTIENSIPAAINRITGLIRSENQDNSSKINWNIGNTAGVFTFPFGNSNSNYIPVRFQVTDGGDVGTVSIATYSTGAADILPLPTAPIAVTNMDNRSGLDNSNNAIHRFWQVDKSGPSGTATVTYTYANADVQNNVIGKENLLQAHRYDKPTDTWIQPALPGQAADAIANTVSVSGVTQFSPWALFFEANNPPLVQNDFYTVDEDNTLTVTAATSVLLNDSDVDGAGAFDGLAIAGIIKFPSHDQAFSVAADGTFTYTPLLNYNGQDTIIFNVCDDGIPKLCAADTVFITINPVNDFPHNSSSTITFSGNPVNQIMSLNVLNMVVDSSDPLGNVDPATVKITVAPMNGSITINPLTGVITYTPNLGFIGIDSYRYEACDDGNPLPSLCTGGLVTMEFLADSDNDGVVDSRDLDDDNDGIPDYNEGCGELIINGSFEKQDFTDPLLFPGGFTGANGTFIGASFNNNELYGWDYTQNLDGWVEGGNWAPAFHGKQYLDVLGNNTHTAGLDNTLSQTIPTIPGNSYVLSFYWDEDFGHQVPEVVTLRASVIDSNNAMVFDVTLNKNAVGPNGAGVRGPNDWQHFTQTFVATTTQTTIQFIATPPGGGDTSAGASLDLVSVMPLTLADCRDTDQDGIPDAMDLDSDGDGIYDVVEAGNSNLDNNQDGIIDGNLIDFGINGLYSGVETDDSEYATTNYQIPHNDLDGIPNYLDLDSDGDGIPDNVEGQATMSYTAPSGNDVDDNGVDDNYDTNGTWIDPVNTDGAADGSDYVDADSDDDGLNDVTEAQIPIIGIDLDNDGLDDIVDADNSSYADPNGIIDDPSLLPDIDGDVLTGGDVDYRDTTDDRPDTDNDGVVDAIDIDDDNDGVSDIEECKKPRFDSGFGLPAGSTDLNWYVEWVDGPAGKQYAPVGIPGIIPAVVVGNLAPGAWIDAPTTSNADWISHPFNAIIGGPGNHIDADMDGVIFERPNLGPPSGPTGDWVALNFSSTINLPVGAAATFFLDFDMAADNGTIGGNANGFAFPVEIYVNGIAQPTALFDYNILTNVNLSSNWIDGNNLIEIKVYSGPNIGGLLIANTTSTLDNCDTDNDGIPNHLDLDSDNDGIYDIVENGVLNEAGVTDDNNDGMIDGNPADFGNNGLFNGIENNDTPAGTITYTPNDTDSDSIIDAQELDADADGCNDVIEAGFTDDDFDGLLGESPLTVDGFGLVTNAAGYTTPVQNSTGGFAFQDMSISNGCSLMAVDDSIVGGNSSFIEGNVLDNDVANYTDVLIVNTTPVIATTNGTLVVNADGSFSYTPNAGFIGQDSFVYEVCDDLIPQQCDQATVTITITKLTISEGFSPNGDGINDYWFMEGINAYPLNKVKVFNRWGNMVYQTSGYDNNTKRWDGVSTEGSFLGKKTLPEGTYFYVLDLGDGSTVVKGFITIKK